MGVLVTGGSGRVGMAVTTRTTFTSEWLIVAAAFALGSPVSGPALMAGYGVGRAALVATGPLLLRGQDEVAMLDGILTDADAWHRFHACLLVIVAAPVAALSSG